jgi:putative transposase
MSYGYGLDLRKKVVDYIENGHSKASACRIFAVGRATLYRWLSLKQEQGNLSARLRIRRSHKLEKERLEKFIAKHPDAYLLEIAQHMRVSGTAVFKACRRWGITRKKNLILQRKKREQAGSLSRSNRKA